MLKKLSIKTNFILIGIVVGLFVGVSVRQALGDSTSVPGTVRADNLTVNTSGQYTNGLIVANGNALVPNGKVGIGTINPSEALTVTGKVLSSGGFCIGTSCITNWNDLKTMLGIGTTTPPPNIPTSYTLAVIKEGTGTGTVVSAPTGINCGSACAYTFSSGASVTLTANKAAGSVFTGWSDACTGATTSCTVVMSSAKNVRATFTSGTETPPPVCTGTHPAAGNGVVLYDYSAVTVSPAPPGGANTVWQYGQSSCGWGCKAPMLRDGDVGCKNPTPGSGATITLNDLSTGGKLSGIALNPQTIIGLSGAAAIGLGGTNGVFTTDSDGKTPEFWLSDFGTAGWTVVVVNVPGYKIRSADGCAFDVSIHANKTNNRCMGLKNGTPVTINMVPGDISTLPTTHFDTLTYHRGETLKGSITGGDPNDTWGCMDSPNTVPGHECTSGWTNVWRKLTVPYDGHADGWQLVETNQGDSMQLGGLLIEQGFPLGTYTMYVKTGQWGVPSQTTSKSITVVSGGGDSNVPTLSLSAFPSSISQSTSSKLSWTATNATWCWAEPWTTPIGTVWKTYFGLNSESTGNLTTTQTYTMKCGNGNATQDVTKSVTVTVRGS